MASVDRMDFVVWIFLCNKMQNCKISLSALV